MFVRYHIGHDPFSRWHRVAREYPGYTDFPAMYRSSCGLYFYRHDNNVTNAPSFVESHCTTQACATGGQLVNSGTSPVYERS